VSNSSPYVLVAGCSHSDSKLDYIEFEDFWPNQLAKHLNYELVNLGKGGACASYVSQELIKWLTEHNDAAPVLVIAQWPNPYRSMEIINQSLIFSNVNSQSKSFKHRLKYCPESFWEEWTQSIINLNNICKRPLINICLENAEIFQDRLNCLDNIQIHIDEKLPGKTWHFDSAANDKMHHSRWCHQKWTERMLTIINSLL
jgi:hypothetical protein